MKAPPKGDDELVIALGAEPKEGGGEEEGYDEEATDAAASLLDAIKSEDPAAMVEAFRAMKAVC